jgi:MFS family permease
VAGCFLLAASLAVLPLLGPASGGLTGLLISCAVLSLGNALASPALTSLVSKISPDHEQGSSLGILQSGASLARAIGPMIGGVLLNNAVNTIDDTTVIRTFWTASGVMFVALLTAIYTMQILNKKPVTA